MTMDPDFWHQRWQANQIGFHEGQANALLVEHFGKLGLAKGARVFLPLCGKTRDIDWLMSQDYQVAGAELSTLAVEQLFAEHGIDPTITPLGALTRYSANRVDIFAGNIFDLGADALGKVDAIYDRAALVAFQNAMRKRYTAHLMKNTARAAVPDLLRIRPGPSRRAAVLCHGGRSSTPLRRAL
jgi:thiopurine S-methyltransferase